MATPERKRVKELYLALLEIAPEERTAFLERESADAALRAEVEALLGAAERADDWFGRIDGAVRGALDSSEGPGTPAADLSGREIGPYHLTALIGRGGMGSVYRAERVDGQFSQEVAIKLSSRCASQPELHRRFLAEREILARLQHRHIARLFDGGVTDDGTPFFVMELVDGTPLDTCCDELELGVRERLELFVQVCDAVAYAHENAIVHRDIKPANVLVSKGEVKLLDFGIAKLLEDAGPGRAETATGMAPMTPAYASPEQLRAEAVTPATDVYALGVLLHELLTGVLPYETKSASQIALMNAICEEPITRPSDRFARASTVGREGAALESIAKARKTTTQGLKRRIRGDLDTILLTTLRKDPRRRYASAAELAQDLRRHLAGFPVRARRESRVYRATRFAARHRVAMTVAAVALVLVGALLGVSFWLASSNTSKEETIAHERERTGELLLHLTELYDAADPYASPGASSAARGLLDTAVARLRETPSGDPETRAALFFAAGRVYRRLAATDEAHPLLEECLRLRRQRLEAPHENLAAALFELGATSSRSGRREEGLGLLREALAMERELHGDDALHVAQVRYELALAFHNAGGAGDAGREFREAVRIYRALASEPSDECGEALLALGDFVAVTGGIPEATELYEEALELFSELHGDEHPTVARTLDGLGMLYFNSARQAEGVELLRAAVRIQRQAFGPGGHPALAYSLQNLGSLLAHEGDDEGVALLREAVELNRSFATTDKSTLAFCLSSLGQALREHDPEEASRAYEEALAAFAAADANPLFRVSTQEALATLLLGTGGSERALELLEEIAETYGDALGEDHPRAEAARAALAEARGE